MGKKGMIVGDGYSTVLTEGLMLRLKETVKRGITDYGVTGFYFGNNADEFINVKHSNEINEFIAREIAQYKACNKDIKSYLVLARKKDICKHPEAFDCIFQGVDFYGNPFVNEFYFRDKFLAAEVDVIFWYSDKNDIDGITLLDEAKTLKKEIVWLT